MLHPVLHRAISSCSPNPDETLIATPGPTGVYRLWQQSSHFDFSAAYAGHTGSHELASDAKVMLNFA